MRAESCVAASDARTLDLPDREGDLLVRRVRGRQGLQDLERLRPSRFAVAAEHEGGLQHASLPVIGGDPQDIVDRRGGVIVGSRDLRTVLELLVKVDLATEQVLAAGLARAVRETNRSGEVNHSVQLSGRRVVGPFRLRLLELRANLEVHGAWNVKEFQGYMIQRSLDLGSVRGIDHAVRPAVDGAGNRRIEDRLLLTTANDSVDILVSRGPDPTLPDADFAVLRDAVLGRQAK